jgi:hypothetical protein
MHGTYQSEEFMPSNRRNFLEEILAAGALMGLAPGEGLSQQQAPPAAPPPGAHDSISFWNSFYDNAPSRGRNAVAEKLPAPERQVRFLNHGSKGLRYTSDIKPDELLDHGGDVSVTVNLGQFRPGVADRAAFKQLQSSSLRLDCVQTRPMMNLFAPLAWASMASLFPDKQGKLPSLQTLGFHSASSTGPENKVVLPFGLGKMAVNVSMVRKESLLHKILIDAQQIAGIASPFFAFPAISIPALKAVTTIYSALEQHTSFLLNSPLTMTVATQRALDDETREVQYLPLVSGDYVLVPKVHEEELSKSMDKLDVLQGYLVDRNAPANQSPEARAGAAIPNVTYVTMRVTVAALPAGSAVQSKPEPEGGGDSGGGAASAPKKAGSTGSTQKKKK